MRRNSLVPAASIVVSVCGILLAVGIAWLIRVPIALFLLAVGLSAALGPAIQWLTGRGLSRGLAIALVYVVAAAVVLAIPLAAAAPLASEFDQFVTQFQQASKARPRSDPAPGQLQAWVAMLTSQVQNRIGESLNLGPSAFWNVLGFTFGAFEVLGNLVIVFVLSIYWSADRDHFERLWLSVLSVEHREPARDLWHEVQAEVGAYIRSEAVQCFLAGTLLLAAYHFIGFPFPVLLALLGALAWLLPFVGLLIVILAALVLSIPAMAASGEQAVMMTFAPTALSTLAILGCLEYLVEPRFFNRKRYNSLLVLLVVAVAADTFGIVGLLLGPPVAAALQLTGGYLLRRQSDARQSSEEVQLWQQRLRSVKQLARETPSPAPELLNLLDRLEDLTGQARIVRIQQQAER